MSKRRRMLALPALVAVLAMIFSGCGGSKAPVSAVSSAAPDSNIPGYYSANQSLSGGVDLKYINLRDIAVEKQASDYVVTLTFKDGSIQMGMQEIDTKGVPKYSTQWLGGLNRLVLNIQGLAYWDLKVWEDELKDTPILGIFYQIPVDDPDAMLTKLYINLKDNIAYKIEEKGNKLYIYLRAMPAVERTDYYVLLNAYEEYTEGKISEDEGFTPTLCKDKLHVTLISQPFATQEEAQAFLNNVNASLVPKLPGTVASVVQMKNTDLPDYDETGALNAFTKIAVTRKNGVENAADAFISNGTLLCWQPGDIRYAFTMPLFLGGDGGEEAKSFEMLYMSSVDSATPALLSPFEYADIYEAEFSDSGRYLAFLNQGDMDRTLYIYDTQKNQVITAFEHGFGVDTASFTWGSGEYADTIFAITGVYDMLQLMSYTLSDNQMNAETLVENSFTEGDIGFFDGKVYYSQIDGEDSQGGVYVFDPATKAITRICDGNYFTMNRRTGAMAVQTIVDDNNYNLNLYDPRTKALKPIAQNKPIEQCIWSSDGSSLYYTVYKDNADDEKRFKLTLNQYSTLSNQNSEVCDIVGGVLNPSDKSSEIMLTCLYPQNNQYVAITYRVSVAE
jgi:hypothetical protein